MFQHLTPRSKLNFLATLVLPCSEVEINVTISVKFFNHKLDLHHGKTFVAELGHQG